MSWLHNKGKNCRRDLSDYINYVLKYIKRRPNHLPTLEESKARPKTNEQNLCFLQDENDKKLEIYKSLKNLTAEINKKGRIKKINAILDCVDANLTEIYMIWIQLDNGLSDN